MTRRRLPRRPQADRQRSRSIARTPSSRAHPLRALVTVLLSHGLRKVEALGLTWADLHLDAAPATLTVRRALKKGGLVGGLLDAPKTTGSQRAVPCLLRWSTCCAGTQTGIGRIFPRTPA